MVDEFSYNNKNLDGAAPVADSYVLAFDTANEVIALGVGKLEAETCSIQFVASREVAAHRTSNTQLLPLIDTLLKEKGITPDSLSCILCGRGSGSFTGVRIALATAKGIASALEVPLFALSTLDSIAWQVQDAGIRGHLMVIADAMRKEVYPVSFVLDETGVTRLVADTVIKVDLAAQGLETMLSKSEYLSNETCQDTCSCKEKTHKENIYGADFYKVDLPKIGAHSNKVPLFWIAGDGLKKYAELFAPLGDFVDEAMWTPTGKGLLLTAQAAWRTGNIDPFDPIKGNPAFALPLYTRLSDAEENERIRLSKNEPKNLRTGVQDEGLRRDQKAVVRDTAIINAQPDALGVVYRPLDAAHAVDVAVLEAALMGADSWSEGMILDELPRKDRVWWAAYIQGEFQENLTDDKGEIVQNKGEHQAFLPPTRLVAYAGGWIIDGHLQILRIACTPEFQRQGIGRSLLGYMASNARDLGAKEASLEVRLSNEEAQAFYRSLAFEKVGVRPCYYSNGEDALIMQGSLPFTSRDVAGMELQLNANADGDQSSAMVAAIKRPLILAIETSCDETAAAIIDGEGRLLSDVVASQIDFHARFGGVVPEIASRKHIEAICGVTQEGLSVAAKRLGKTSLGWKDLDAVSVVYTPGLVGALVVGLAFAKGAAWAAGLPLVGVNHLEGHIYANKLATTDITPPLVVSLVSGGNTMLVQVKDWGDYTTLGSTIDDAVGEAFDKVAKVMGLGYPGGPAISKIAGDGNPKAMDFPRAMLHSGDLRFSLSGLKTAVITYIHKEEAARRPLNKADIAASFQQAVIDVQVAKAETALKLTGAKEFCLGGGVAANKALREAYEIMCTRIGVRLTLPPMHACTDNAGMIALVALDRFRKGKFFSLDIDVCAHADLDEAY